MSSLNPFLGIEPLADVVLVKPLEAPAMTKGGIVIPDSAQQREEFHRGLVERVGPGAITLTGAHIPPAVQVGDLVFYGRYAGSWMDVFGRVRLALMENELKLRVPAGKFELVTHADEKAHLAGESCEACQSQALTGGGTTGQDGLIVRTLEGAETFEERRHRLMGNIISHA